MWYICFFFAHVCPLWHIGWNLSCLLTIIVISCLDNQPSYSHSQVMYISIHRHDGGNFFPGTGAPEETGAGSGVGTNANIAW